VFSFDTVSDAITVLSPNSVIEYDGVHFWAGVDRFFMYAGAVREVPNPFNSDFFFDRMNPEHRNKTFAFRNSRHGEIWWCFCKDDAEWPNHAVVFNVRNQFWYDTPLPNGGRSCAASPLTFPYPLMGGVDLVGATYKLWQHETGVDEVDGVNVSAIRSYYQTSDVSLLVGQEPKDSSIHIDKVEPDFDQIGDMTLTLLGNQNARSPDYEERQLTFGDDPEARGELVNLKATRRQMRFRFESNVVGGDYKAGKIIAHIEPSDGRRA
jgi:hypothetical protein